mmetsp:Transcript_12977/g.29932  ORF Transcript_12977/g.29932 Transcript_12977/m.29932 type:complete len:441 (+) Transcript_12977:37-1359(+)
MAEVAETPEDRFYQGMQTSGLGFKLLSKMGWEQGKGLGANEDGISRHVWVKKKADVVGIGGTNKIDWTASTNTYNDLLSRLKTYTAEDASSSSESDSEKKKKKKSKKDKKDKKRKSKPDSEDESEDESDKKKTKKSKSKKKAESSDDEETEAEAKRKRKEARKKAKRAAAEEKSSSSSSSEEDAAPARSSGTPVCGRTKMQMRFGYKKILRAKSTSNYSEQDIKNIFYEKSSAAKAAAPVGTKGDLELAKLGPGGGASPPTKPQKPAKIIKPDDDSSASSSETLPGPKNKFFGTAQPHQFTPLCSAFLKRVFVRATPNEDSKTGNPERGRQEFTEETQENIWTEAHEKAITQKKGLGFTRVSKLGKDFAGAKVTFDEEGNAEGGEPAEAVEADDDAAADKKEKKDRKKKKDKKKRKAEAEAEEEEAEVADKKKKKKKRKD